MHSFSSETKTSHSPQAKCLLSLISHWNEAKRTPPLSTKKSSKHHEKYLFSSVIGNNWLRISCVFFRFFYFCLSFVLALNLSYLNEKRHSADCRVWRFAQTIWKLSARSTSPSISIHVELRSTTKFTKNAHITHSVSTAARLSEGIFQTRSPFFAAKTKLLIVGSFNSA